MRVLQTKKERGIKIHITDDRKSGTCLEDSHDSHDKLHTPVRVNHDDLFPLNTFSYEIVSKRVCGASNLAISIGHGTLSDLFKTMNCRYALNHTRSIRIRTSIGREDVGNGAFPSTPVKVNRRYGKRRRLRRCEERNRTDRSERIQRDLAEKNRQLLDNIGDTLLREQKGIVDDSKRDTRSKRRSRRCGWRSCDEDGQIRGELRRANKIGVFDLIRFVKESHAKERGSLLRALVQSTPQRVKRHCVGLGLVFDLLDSPDDSPEGI